MSLWKKYKDAGKKEDKLAIRYRRTRKRKKKAKLKRELNKAHQKENRAERRWYY